MANLAAAKAYLTMGLHPIPCRPRDKVPLVPWREFQTVAPTVEQLESWWGKTPDANVALVLGRGMFAVDLDGGTDAEQLLAEHGIALPIDAPRSKTGSGYHVFLSSYNPIPDRVGLLSTAGGRAQVDIRGIGIVVAPPSTHPNGSAYEWLVPLTKTPPHAPQALHALIHAAPAAPLPVAGTPSSDGIIASGNFWVSDALRGVGEGQRDQMCTRLAGFFLKKGLDASTVSALLSESFGRNCQPSFDARDVEKCVQSIARRESAQGKDRTIAAAHIADILRDLVDTIAAGPSPVLPTPFPTLNLFLSGGFGPGELIFLGARPGIGKTALGLEFARKTALAGGAVLMVSREMTNLALGRRLVAQDARIRATALKRSTLNDTEQYSLRQAVTRLSKTPLFMTDDAVSFTEIQTIVDDMADQTSVSLIVVDYLQLIRAGLEVKERRHQIEAVSQGLKTLAMRYKVPVLCLSSLSRASNDDKHKPPTLSSLRESGELEHDADIILLLHRQYHEEATTCYVAKNRDGRLGIVSLLFRPEFVAFDECAEQGDES